jgi:hypothetical protein
MPTAQPPATAVAASPGLAWTPAAPRLPTPGLRPTPTGRAHPKASPHRPTLTPTPVLSLVKRSARRKRTPTPAPTLGATAPLAGPTVQLAPATAPSLGCLDSAPEPFGEGGVYLGFCLSKEAWVRIVVYGDRGRTLWRSPEKGFSPGRQQWFYDGLVNRVPVTAGTYVFEVQARYMDGQKESRQGSITRAPRKRS